MSAEGKELFLPWEQRAQLLDPGQHDPSRTFTHLYDSATTEGLVEYAAWVSLKNAQEVDGNVVPVPPSHAHYQAEYEAGNGPHGAFVARRIPIGRVHNLLGLVSPFARRFWDEDTYIENSLWASHFLGTPEHPVVLHREELDTLANLYLTPEAHPIKKLFGPRGGIEYINDRIGFVTGVTLDRWVDDQRVDNGVWLSHLLGSSEQPHFPERDDIAEAGLHRVSLSINKTYEYFDDIPSYKKRLMVRHYSRWYQGEPVRDADAVPDDEYVAGLRVIMPIAAWAETHNRGRSPGKTSVSRLQTRNASPTWRNLIDFFGSEEAMDKAVQDAITFRQSIAWELANTYSDADDPYALRLARHLTKDVPFEEETEESKTTLRGRLQQLIYLRDEADCDISGLLNLFEGSRETDDWSTQQYLYVGKTLIGVDYRTFDQNLEALRVLSEANLMPETEALTRAFGSIPDFISACGSMR